MSREPYKFTLHKEGIFYKCYNEDAMLFVKHIKPYKIRHNHVKVLGEDVMSLGFPTIEVEKGNLNLDKISSAIGAVSYKEGTDGIEFSLKEVCL